MHATAVLLPVLLPLLTVSSTSFPALDRPQRHSTPGCMQSVRGLPAAGSPGTVNEAGVLSQCAELAAPPPTSSFEGQNDPKQLYARYAHSQSLPPRVRVEWISLFFNDPSSTD